MKKGLTIALLMVAMVALAASASAIAPTIGNLPAVIIGDAGDVSGAGTTALHLLKYDNVFNLADPGVVSRPNNPSTTTFLSVFYTTSGTLRASNATTKVQPLTAGEIANLGTTVPTAKKINTATSLWLSLIHDAGTTSPASGPAATAAQNGATTTVLVTKGVLVGGTNPLAGQTVLSLYATDWNAATTAIGTRSIVVYSIIGANDGLSNVVGAKEYDADSAKFSATGHDGWVYLDRLGDEVGPNSNLQVVPKLEAATGIGFTGLATFAASKSMGFSSWIRDLGVTPSLIIAKASGMAGNIFRAKMHLSGSAATVNTTPAFRFLFFNRPFAHVGGFAIQGTPGPNPSAINAPFTGNPVDLRLYWGVPALNGMGDSDPAATSGGAAGDPRDYNLFFDTLQTEAGDNGTIVMESLTVERIMRPVDVAPKSAWGTVSKPSGDVTGQAFTGAGNTNSTSWLTVTSDRIGWGGGTATINAGNATIGISGQGGFPQINPAIPTGTGLAGAAFPAWSSNQLVRMTYALTCDINTTPDFRVLVLPVIAPSGTAATTVFGGVFWGESITPSGFATSGAFKVLQSAGKGCPMAVKGSGSVLETYIWSQNAPTAAAEASVLVPLMDVDIQPGNPAFPTINGYALPSTAITVNGLTMEVCGQN